MEEKRVDDILDAILNADTPLMKDTADTVVDAAENTAPDAVGTEPYAYSTDTASDYTYDYNPAPAENYSYDSSLDTPAPAKKKLSGKAIAIIVAVVVAVLCLIASLVGDNGISFGGNGYTEPLKAIEKYYNLADYDAEDEAYDYLNGFLADEFRDLREVLHNSDYYMSLLEEVNQENRDFYDTLVDEFGQSYKLKISVQDKTALTADELEEIRQGIQDEIDWLYEYAEVTADITEEEWEALAEYEFGMDVGSVKKFVALCEKLGEKYSDIEVTEGYHLDAVYHVTTDELPYLEDVEFTVFKVNGCWVEEDFFYRAIDLYYYWE